MALVALRRVAAFAAVGPSRHSTLGPSSLLPLCCRGSVAQFSAEAAPADAKQAPLPADFTPKPKPPPRPPVARGPAPLPQIMQRATARPAVSLADGLRDLKAAAHARETVEIAVKLGIDPKRGDQIVRGAAVLPHGTGRSVRLAVFALESDADDARRAGADIVGGLELIERIKAGGSGAIDFDRCIATPAAMPLLAPIARILGPRGLMPNPKAGTVTRDVAAAIAETKKGRVEFRADAGGCVHAGLGKASFSHVALADNVGAFLAAVVAAKPKAVKAGAGGYVLSVVLSTTQARRGVLVKPA